MAYKLKEGKEFIFNDFNFSNAIALVDIVIPEKREQKATIFFKIFADNSYKFELASYNITVKNAEYLSEEEEIIKITDFTDYFANILDMNADVITILKDIAYKYINDKELSIGLFTFEDWENDN